MQDDVRKDVKFKCVTQGIPFAVIGFGKMEDSGLDSASLYVVAGVSPKKMYKKLWEEARHTLENEDNEDLPSNDDFDN